MIFRQKGMKSMNVNKHTTLGNSVSFFDIQDHWVRFDRVIQVYKHIRTKRIRTLTLILDRQGVQ